MSSTGRAVNTTPPVSDCTEHFERMLYDNAQLARVYLHAWQVTGELLYRTITRAFFHFGKPVDLFLP